uniref:RWP-RK domain-containing protein n=1 Tax=Leersia perrieri TaxID=77586 RepID=A0A0D9V1Y1_9ORYZ
MEMHECSYYGGIDDVDVDWFQPLASIPPLPYCSSWPPSPPFLLSEHDDILHAAGDHGAALPGIGGCSTADIVIKKEEDSPVDYQLPFPALPDADVHHHIYHPLHPDHFVPSPAAAGDGAAAAVGRHHDDDDDDLLMLPFCDIDLDAFAEDARDADVVVHDELKPSPPHHQINLDAANAQFDVDGVNQQHDAVDDDQDSLSMVVVEGYEMGALKHAAEQKPQLLPAAGTTETSTVSPLLLPPPRRVMRSRGRVGSSSAAAGGGNASTTRLDHIGFEELRRYFYMPITRAAREMNVGLTVLKKRCRELGVARWPHRKMKSLKSLILNVQEMGRKGMAAEAMRRELEGLEKCCALMEQDPAVELTERTKKLRQACFKENYKRRRAAAVDMMMLDHCFNDLATGADLDVHGYQQQLALPLPPPPPPRAPTAGNSRRIEFLGY